MRLEKRKEILYERLGNEILALDMRKNVPYILNNMAAIIFYQIEKGLNPEEIAISLCMDYEVNFPEALNDVHEMINDFMSKEILISSHPLC